ncbi:MAG: hypothetical protein ACYDCM_12710 [Candidatus Acidiferrales bacterium]
MSEFFIRAGGIVFGLVIVWVGRWMFFHPEKTLRKIYFDLMSPSKFSNAFFRVFAVMWVVMGLWVSVIQCIPQALWNRRAFLTGGVLGVLVVTCTFLLLRRNDSARIANNSNS